MRKLSIFIFATNAAIAIVHAFLFEFNAMVFSAIAGWFVATIYATKKH